ncbi:MAG: ATP-grasp domain-containing protein [Lachnospiraceae bacterium]|nr:ATP-grasp domain-containing protein [Lachnospiraceae bacterium]
MSTNVLVLSAGTRNKIIQYFKMALTDKSGKRIGNVIATDMSELAPSVYEADKFYKVPRMTADGYIDVILDICKKEKVTGVCSLIDPELSLLAEHNREFKDIGVTVIGSAYEICESCLDKWKMFCWLEEHHYNCAKTYIDKELFYKDLNEGKIQFPVFVKPVKGSASIAISKVHSREMLDALFSNTDSQLMIQEYLSGQEIGVDCYIDMLSKEVVSIFCKNKIVMRAGETDKAVSFKDDRLFQLVTQFVREFGFCGQIDIDIFEVDGKYYISEVNPRFGGGYPHAYECGVNHMELIVNNLNGIVNKPNIGRYAEGIYMMKYNEVMIKNGEQI